MAHNRSRIGRMAVVVALVGFAAISVHASYDRQAAIDYAFKYWDKACSDGYYFAESTGPALLGAGERLPTDVEGFDCAHFVSCCIGSEPNEPAGGLVVPSRTLAYGEPGAQRLTDWLLGQGATRKDNISELVPGDIVAYDADHNGWIEHVTLYMGDGLVTSHSLSRYSEWNPDPESDFLFLHLPGGYEPPIEKMFGLIRWGVITIFLAGLAATLFLFSAR